MEEPYLHNTEMNTQADSVWIIVPVYNTEHLLDKCIKSTLNQTYSNQDSRIIATHTPKSFQEKLKTVVKRILLS